ncbi:MAG: hypothetical protein IT204_20385 [Fimbriimonadaceae bacterium]|nr:hypothetical protein [Fimbriimonadaceae bacterium]
MRRVVRSWWQLLPALWPALLLAYLLNLLALTAAGRWPDEALVEVLRGVLLLGASWLGQVWTAAAWARRAAGGPTAAGALAADLRATPRLLTAGLARAALVWSPVLLVAVAGALRPAGEQQVGQVNLLPVLALLLLPLSANLAALLAPLPAVLVLQRPATVGAAIAASRSRAEAALVPLLAWGAVLLAAVALSSFLPGGRLFPNHAAGSLLWVLQVEAYARARRLAEPDWLRGAQDTA